MVIQLPLRVAVIARHSSATISQISRAHASKRQCVASFSTTCGRRERPTKSEPSQPAFEYSPPSTGATTESLAASPEAEVIESSRAESALDDAVIEQEIQDDTHAEQGNNVVSSAMSAYIDTQTGEPTTPSPTLIPLGPSAPSARARTRRRLRNAYERALAAAENRQVIDSLIATDGPANDAGPKKDLTPLYSGKEPEYSAPFRIGRKKVYLPRFRVALIRDRLPAHYATFLVPLEMNKLDMRDYMLHAYNVRCVSITSRVMNGRVSDEGDPNIERPQQGRLYREAPTKKMTVLMDKAFVWPPEPDKEALNEHWDQKTFKQAERSGQDSREQAQQKDTFVDRQDRDLMREQAKALLEGKTQWKPPTRAQGNWAVSKVTADDELRL